MTVSQQDFFFFFFLWHCFILQHLLVEVQLISHVNGIDLLFLFPIFFPQKREHAVLSNKSTCGQESSPALQPSRFCF